ncbi:uncharacterized protein MKS88_000044 [Plasmodium brasilianum]|uniref:uncharacterized protein n=1 Tax=Plasmodium brasilianum TaxID=5824 RepID=UPI00350E4CC1|nr:hypothetical protein MKS88_000044 [Plasmodium brasilianum]
MGLSTPSERKYFKLFNLAKQLDECQHDLLSYHKMEKKTEEEKTQSDQLKEKSKEKIKMEKITRNKRKKKKKKKIALLNPCSEKTIQQHTYTFLKQKKELSKLQRVKKTQVNNTSSILKGTNQEKICILQSVNCEEDDKNEKKNSTTEKIIREQVPNEEERKKKKKKKKKKRFSEISINFTIPYSKIKKEKNLKLHLTKHPYYNYYYCCKEKEQKKGMHICSNKNKNTNTLQSYERNINNNNNSKNASLNILKKEGTRAKRLPNDRKKIKYGENKTYHHNIVNGTTNKGNEQKINYIDKNKFMCIYGREKALSNSSTHSSGTSTKGKRSTRNSSSLSYYINDEKRRGTFLYENNTLVKNLNILERTNSNNTKKENSGSNPDNLIDDTHNTISVLNKLEAKKKNKCQKNKSTQNYASKYNCSKEKMPKILSKFSRYSTNSPHLSKCVYTLMNPKKSNKLLPKKWSMQKEVGAKNYSPMKVQHKDVNSQSAHIKTCKELMRALNRSSVIILTNNHKKKSRKKKNERKENFK